MRIVSSTEAYREWAETFDDSTSPILALESRVVAPLLGDVRGLTVIDIGCGTARWMRTLLQRGAIVAGLDASAEMLRVAGAKPDVAGRLVLGDGRTPPFRPGAAQLVLCCLTIGHLQPVTETLRSIAALLAPGGRLIVTDFHPDALRKGWKRTYRHNGETVEMESRPYSLDELRAQDLDLELLAEPSFEEEDRAFFRSAGRGDLFERACEVAAIYVASFRRSFS